MAHIHTDAGQHDATVSAFIIRTDGDEPRALLHRHKKLGVYLQFGGHIELHENPWQALAHELLEESGYDMGQLQLLQPQFGFTMVSEFAVQHPMPFLYNTHPFNYSDHFHTDATYALITSEPPRHAIGEGEADTLQLFTAAELRALEAADIYPDVRQAGLFVLEELLHEWKPVATP